MRRTGFTLIEVIGVLSILGTLAIIAVPPLRRTVVLAQGGALTERVRVVQLAYADASSPLAEELQAPLGVVPAKLGAMLLPGHFHGEGEVEFTVVGRGTRVWLMLVAITPKAQEAREAFHRLARTPHLHTSDVTLVPLSADLVALLEGTSRPTSGTTSGIATGPATGPASGSTTGATGGATTGPTSGSTSGPGARPDSGATVGTGGAPSGAPSGTASGGNAPSQPPPVSTPPVQPSQSSSNCSPYLPPGQLRQCHANPTGWFLHHHQ